MRITMKGKTLLKGHSLIFEGRAIGSGTGYGVSVGYGKCTCGAISPELPSTSQRQKWHREHKQDAKEQACKS